MTAKKKAAREGKRARLLHKKGAARIGGGGNIRTAGTKDGQGTSHVRIGALAGTASFGFSSNATLSADGALAGTTASRAAPSASAKRTAANRANASKPRKSVTKAKLVAFRDQFQIDYGTTRGWKNAAHIKFFIDPKTLNTRMKE